MPQETYVSPLQRALIVSGWRHIDPGWACHQGGRRRGRHALVLLRTPSWPSGGWKKKRPFLGNTDGLGTSLSFYFKRIKSEPDLQSDLWEVSCAQGASCPRGRRGLLPGLADPCSLSSCPPPAPPHFTPLLKAPYALPVQSKPRVPPFLPFSPLSSVSVMQVVNRLLSTVVSFWGKPCDVSILQGGPGVQ